MSNDIFTAPMTNGPFGIDPYTGMVPGKRECTLDTLQQAILPTGFRASDFERIRRNLADQGYRVMHRRNGQYWVMFDKPMTVAEMNVFHLFGTVNKLPKTSIYIRNLTGEISRLLSEEPHSFDENEIGWMEIGSVTGSTTEYSKGCVVRLCHGGDDVSVHIEDVEWDGVSDEVWRKVLSVAGWCTHDGLECLFGEWRVLDMWEPDEAAA
jgi:hypothetical protein